MASQKRSRENDEHEGMAIRGAIDDGTTGKSSRRDESKRRKVEDPFFPYSKYTTKFQFPTSFERTTSQFKTSTPTSQSAGTSSSNSLGLSWMDYGDEINMDKSAYRSPPVVSPPSSPLSSRFRRGVKLTRSSSSDDNENGRNLYLYNEDERSSGSEGEIVLGKSPYPLIKKPKNESRATLKDLPILGDLSIEELNEPKIISHNEANSSTSSSRSGRNPFMNSTSSNISTSSSQFSSSQIKTPPTFGKGSRPRMGKGDGFDDIFSPSTPSTSSSSHLPNLFAPRKSKTSITKEEEESPTRLLTLSANFTNLPIYSARIKKEEGFTDEDTDMINTQL